jgi:outer membrane lipoprotein-sorting protein
MKKTWLLISAFISTTTYSQPNANTLLERVDANMASENRIAESTMIIHGRRDSRTIMARTWSVGTEKSFTEYLSPAREQGTKMLKLENQLWIYSPSTDRTIQIAGHMLRQSVMGSDLSYEDMMDTRKLTDVYKATLEGEATIEGRPVWVVHLQARVDDIAYHSRKLWIDTERYIPLKEELYAKSGQLLKRTTFSEVKQIDGRWFPTVMHFKDMLKQGEGTEFRITGIKFNQDIPEHMFTKAVLRR